MMRPVWRYGIVLVASALGQGLPAQAQHTHAAGYAAGTSAQPVLRYHVDLTDTAHHVFSVVLTLPPLAAANSVFEFAATAPGTYQTMNIGRFVRDFMAYDGKGAPVATEHISTNEWQLSAPERVRRITYQVLATRDTAVTTDPIYPMCGTALDASYALINGQGVFGFPRGMQAVPLTIHLVAPAGWTHGTPLAESDGVFKAASYDRLVDSPILLGPHLTRTTFDVTGVPVTIVVRAEHNDIQADQLRVAMRDMLNAAGSFLGKLPVDHYTFLYDFGPVQRISGAWEHSYGSEYVLADLPYTPKYGGQIRSMAAHEFFHVETPLNIHSEIIEHFNFATPVASQHLWLYEGTTEWAAQKMQLVSGLLTLPQYLGVILQKARGDRTAYDTTWSLRKMSLASYSDSGQQQYPNIYARGALVAGLLDIKLLEESGGKRGLRELVLELAKEYGKQRPFPENGLIDTIVARTSPDVRDFFTRYILGSERPPVKEYYAKLGIALIEDEKGLPVRLEPDPAATPEQLRLRQAWMRKE
jgi:predicted metalloprotease with PDZ domain